MTDKERIDIARRAARRYAYLSWVNVEDATQEALTAMVEAERRFNEKPDGQNLAGYLTRTAQYAVRWFVWSSTSPVTHSDRSNISAEVTELRRAEVSDETVGEAAETPSKLLEERDWLERVRKRFAELCDGDAEVDQVIAHLCLLHEQESEVVAEIEDVPLRNVYVVTQRIRNRILRDAQMFALLKERKS
jgi:DNA-directed RNA polymerase specialized sigma24 family protein